MTLFLSSDTDDFAPFLSLTTKYALVAVGLFLFQLFPVTGIFAMLGAGYLWIGALVHLYMIHIGIAALISPRFPKIVLLLPAVFYLSGCAFGLYSDVMFSRWQKGKVFIDVRQAVPSSVRYLAFEPVGMIEASNLFDPNGDFKPEQHGFQLAELPRGQRAVTMEWSPFAKADPWCPHARGIWKVGNRCYRDKAIIPDGTFVLIEQESDSSVPRVVEKYPWGDLSHTTKNIVLYRDGTRTMVGHLSAASVLASNYFWFPTAGCGLGNSKWSCQWGINYPFPRMLSAGFQPGEYHPSRTAARALMQALERLRASNS